MPSRSRRNDGPPTPATAGSSMNSTPKPTVSPRAAAPVATTTSWPRSLQARAIGSAGRTCPDAEPEWMSSRTKLNAPRYLDRRRGSSHTGEADVGTAPTRASRPRAARCGFLLAPPPTPPKGSRWAPADAHVITLSLSSGSLWPERSDRRRRPRESCAEGFGPHLDPARRTRPNRRGRRRGKRGPFPGLGWLQSFSSVPPPGRVDLIVGAGDEQVEVVGVAGDGGDR